jgi:hypothetical protein
LTSFNIKKDTVTFASGHTLYAHAGIIGISPALELFYGYDGEIYWPTPEWRTDILTVADMVELADHMIGQWQKFKETLQ